MSAWALKNSVSLELLAQRIAGWSYPDRIDGASCL